MQPLSLHASNIACYSIYNFWSQFCNISRLLYVIGCTGRCERTALISDVSQVSARHEATLYDLSTVLLSKASDRDLHQK